MFYKKKGLPEEEEIVICTTKKILPHAVFVSLDEYENLEGMLHISEVSPGRIRTLGDYVKVGKRLICKVLRVNREKRHVDLSLRRVPQALRIKKNEELKQEERAEKILELVGEKLKKDLKTVYIDIGYGIIEKFGTLYACFSEIVSNKDVINDLKLPKNYEQILVDIVKEKIKPPRVSIKATFVLKSSASNGIKIIKDALIKGEDLAKKNNYDLKLRYIGAPNYEIEVSAANYKLAEEALKKVSDIIIENIKKEKGSGELVRK